MKAPARVQFLYTMSMMKQPVGRQMVEDAMRESPEYFPDELELRRKWALIPQSVHDEYWIAKEKLHAEIFKDMPPSKGILGWITDNDTEGYQKWNEAYQKCRDIERPLEKELHEKFYSEYDIEYNG